MAHAVTLIPGDGIGPEVTEAARTVIDACGAEIEWELQPAGADVVETEGTPLPDRVLESIRQTGTALKGPITTPVGTGFRSVNVALRQELDLFAAVRPSRSLPGVESRYAGVDVVVIRENTEDLYAGIEFEQGSEPAARLRREIYDLAGFEIRRDAGVTLKPISVSGTRRVVRYAFEFARRQGRSKVTVGHKANIMRFSDGLFLASSAGEAVFQPDIRFEEMQVDQLALTLVTDPQQLDVLLLPNLYGDIISDLCAGMVGGLGLAAGANLGSEHAMFEPVHGSAPDIAGKGIANPIAMIRSGTMMLRHLSQTTAAARVERAIEEVLSAGDALTPDMGGTSSTSELAEELAGRVRSPDRPG